MLSLVMHGAMRSTTADPLPKRMVDAERSASVYVRPREDALIAVGGVTALPAAPNEEVIGLWGLWSNGALSPEPFGCARLSPDGCVRSRRKP
jgi:hypothetical protein